MTAIDWDAWRAAYPTMSWLDHVAFYRQVWDRHPVQEQHDRARLLEFFDRIPGEPRVIELGGWRGEAAAAALAGHPAIVGWHNLEICEHAAASPVCDDSRYQAITPNCWPWELPTSPNAAQVAVLSHVIEHMSAAHLTQLAAWLTTLGVRWVYLESPLPLGGVPNWAGQRNSHVLEVSWRGVQRIFGRHGFTLEAQKSRRVRYLRRVG